MLKEVLFISFVVTFCNGQSKQDFRFDYTFNSKADGWLKFHYTPSNWMEARLRCHAEGAVLASPLTRNLRVAMVEFASQQMFSFNAHDHIFIGVHAMFSKGDYASIDGTPLSKLPVTWTPGQPDNYQNEESCLVMRIPANGTLSDTHCSNTYPYICYKKKTEALTLTGCGTYDTDYNMDTRTGSCYKFHRRGLPWSRAYMTCAGEGAYLAIINSNLESTVLKELFAQNPDSTIRSTDPGIAAIGFHDWGERGSWMTIHGETLKKAGFSQFENGQPDNATRVRTGDAGEYCGSIFRSGNLNDVWCNVAIPFICEKNPLSLFADVDD